MRHPMRSTAVLSAILFGLFAASYAETVNVPFAFEAKGVPFPAGQYTVSQNLNHGSLTLQSKQYPAKQFSWVGHPSDVNQKGDTVLSFDKQGSVVVLKSIQNLRWRTNDFSGTHAKSSGEQKCQGND